MDLALNYWAIIVAAISNMVIGFLWYGPVFGKPWKALMGFTDDMMGSMRMKAWQSSVLGIVAALVMAAVFAHIYGYVSASTQVVGGWSGMVGGFWLWLGFVAPVTLGVVLWENKPWKLWFINAGYYLVALAVMGAIIGGWQ